MGARQHDGAALVPPRLVAARRAGAARGENLSLRYLRCTLSSTTIYRFTLRTSFMSTRFNYLHRSLCLVALTLASQVVVSAEPSQSLAEKRLSIFRGTTPGIVIMDFGTTPPAAASKPASVSEPKHTETGPEARTGAAAEANSTGAAAAQPAAAPSFLSALPPPSGRSLQSARRLDAPDQGIVIPTASTTPQPSAEPATKR